MFRRSGRGRLLLLVFVALSLAVITLDFRQEPGGPIERAKHISAAVVAPIQRGVTAVFRPVRDFFASIIELGDLRDHNSELEAELEQVQSAIRQAESLVEENRRLREALELTESYVSMETVTAEVIGRAPSNYKWAVFIDKGRADGIRPDMAVMDADGLVGKVIGAEEHMATILLLIDPRAAAAARIEDGRDTGSVSGNGSTEHLSLELIGPKAEVSVGDDVITAGYDGHVFPPGIPIGRVIEVSEDPRLLERIIRVAPFVDFTAVDFVQVILESGSADPRSKK